MARGKKAHWGFSIIEVALTIGVMTILAGFMVPLGIKVLDQERERATRKSLQIAFEHIFGSLDQDVPNMRCDFAYTPTASLSDLSIMINPASVTGGGARLNVPPWGFNGGVRFMWGFRGPYWEGPANNDGAPVDAWGRAIRLDVNGLPWDGALGPIGPGGNLNVQLRSLGRSGVLNAADNILYPPRPVLLRRYNSDIILRIGRRAPGTNLTGRVRVVTAGNNNNVVLRGDWHNFNNTDRIIRLDGDDYFAHQEQFVISPGMMQLEIVPRETGTFAATTLSIVLKPGEIRAMRVLL